MKVCVTCRHEMKCIKTGCTCVWSGTHVYAADEYQCPVCECKIRVCNTNPYHDSEALSKTHKLPLNMTE